MTSCIHVHMLYILKMINYVCVNLTQEFISMLMYGSRLAVTLGYNLWLYLRNCIDSGNSYALSYYISMFVYLTVLFDDWNRKNSNETTTAIGTKQ